ncbi:MAG: HEAT repeat domain-containing protein [Planctomycetes bacterium]|nr:HEAT repeat domain-containing protein [Planctomycetota bacterium]
MPSTNVNVADLVEQMPAADSPGRESKFTGPPWEAAQKIITPILEGGRESILELIGMIRDATGGGKNYKPGYTLHAMALHVGRPGMESQRKMFCEALASRIGGAEPSKDVQGFLIRELQCAGGPEVVQILGRQLQDEALCEYAAHALIAIGEGAGAELRRALRTVEGKSRATIAQALGALEDKPSSGELRRALSDADRDVRICAAWALARIGDAEAARPLAEAAGKADGWEKIQLIDACARLAESLAAAGQKGPATEVYEMLAEMPGAGEHIHHLARRALSG